MLIAAKDMVIVAASSWQAEVDECLSQSQEEIEQLEDAEACRSSSSDIEDDQLGPVFWWVPRLLEACKKALPDLPQPRPSRMNIKRVISACSGCGAEMEVFKVPHGKGLCHTTSHNHILKEIFL